MLPSSKRTAAVTLLETLIAIAIVLTVLALILPAIQTARGLAVRVECQNQLKQIGLAIHQYANDHAGTLPAVNALANDLPYESLFFCLLPYIDHGSYYTEVKAGLRSHGSAYTMKPYLCPVDPTIDNWNKAEGHCSYAPNALVFRAPRITVEGIPDGTASTLAFAEHYAYAGTAGRRTFFSWYNGRPTEEIELPSHGFRCAYRRASFADVECGDVVPVTNGNPPASVGSTAGLTFQLRPTEVLSDPRIPQTAHHGGMPVAFADGSVRLLRAQVTPQVFWGLVTPRGGETVELPD